MPVFAGRAEVLLRLRKLRATAAEGGGVSLLVRGEPGIGKTRLLREVCTGASVLVAAGRRGPGVPAFWPWIEVWRTVARDQRLPTSNAAAVLQRAFAPWASASATATQSGTVSHFALVDAVTQVVLESARRAPLCLVVEDIHDYDHASLDVVRELASQLTAYPLFMLASCRTAEALAANEQLASTLQCFIQEVTLFGLDRDAVDAVLSDRLGTSVFSALAAQVERRSGGNPLYIHALASVLGAAPPSAAAPLDIAQLRLPESVRIAGREQLDTVSPACRALLSVAAVLGRELDSGLLSGFDGMGDQAAIDALLQHACERGVLFHEPGTRGRYQFTHALLHELIVAEHSAEGLARAHAAAARALCADDRVREPTLWLRTANHLLRAGGEASLERACTLAQRAGIAARERGAEAESAEAFGLFTQAARLLVEASQPDARAMWQRTLARALLAWTEPLWHCGEHPQALGCIVEVAQLGELLNDPQLIMDAALVTLDSRNARLSLEQRALCEKALALQEQLSIAQRVYLLAKLGGELCLGPERERGVALVAEAHAMFARCDDSSVELALAHANVLACDEISLSERNARIEAYAACARRHEDVHAIVWAEAFRLHHAVDAADPDAIARHELALKEATHNTREPQHWLGGLLGWLLLFMRGQFEQAEQALQRYEPSDYHRGSSVPLLHHSQRLALFRLTHGADEVMQAFRDMPAPLREVPELHATCASTYSECGQNAKARASFVQGLRVQPRTVLSLCYLAQAARELEDAAVGQTLYAELLPYKTRCAVIRAGGIGQGAVAHYLGHAAWAAGDHVLAIEHFEQSVQINRAIGAIPALARTHYELARGLFLSKRRAEAEPHAQQAVALTEQLGMVLYTARARALCAELAPLTAANQLRVEGQLWTVFYAGRRAHLEDIKGLHYIACLLQRPEHNVHVLELIAEQSVLAANVQHIDEALHTRAALAPHESALDARALLHYRQRARDLAQTIEEAREQHDSASLERAEAEREFLLQELKAGQRARSVPLERARKAVYNRIRQALQQLEQAHPALAHHLTASIKTGVHCSYRPETQHTWVT